MNAQISAALIAVLGTVVVAIAGFYTTRKLTDKTIEAQQEQQERTLADQRVRTLNERFATAADKLGSDKPAAVRLAGVYAMAGLADDWEENRQTCINVLCAYLRMPYEPDPGDSAPLNERLAFQASREVRHTVIRVIGAHLRPDAAVSWQGRDLDFTSVVFDGADFSRAVFSGGTVTFNHAEFPRGTVSFDYAEVSGGTVSFNHAKVSGGTVNFDHADVSGGEVSFYNAEFSGGTVSFDYTDLSGGRVIFQAVKFSGADARFVSTQFSGSEVSYFLADFTDGRVFFPFAKFSGGKVTFLYTTFTGGEVDFSNTEFSGGDVDFSGTSDWSHPPKFAFKGKLPPGLRLPAAASSAP